MVTSAELTTPLSYDAAILKVRGAEFGVDYAVRSSARSDASRTYNERFDGFIVRKFNGDRMKITSGEVRPL